MVVDESCRPKVAQWLGRCGRSLRGQARKAFHCDRDEIAITSGLHNEGIPKPARSWNPKRASSLKVSHESRLQQRSLAKWPVLQHCNQTGKCSHVLSSCWQKQKVWKPGGSMACRRVELFPEQSKSWPKSLKHVGFPRGHPARY